MTDVSIVVRSLAVGIMAREVVSSTGANRERALEIAKEVFKNHGHELPEEDDFFDMINEAISKAM